MKQELPGVEDLRQLIQEAQVKTKSLSNQVYPKLQAIHQKAEALAQVRDALNAKALALGEKPVL